MIVRLIQNSNATVTIKFLSLLCKLQQRKKRDGGQNRQSQIEKIDVKALKANEELRASFLNAVKEEMSKPFMQNSSNIPEHMNANIVTLLKTAADSTLPKLSKKKVKEMGKSSNR